MNMAASWRFPRVVTSRTAAMTSSIASFWTGEIGIIGPKSWKIKPLLTFSAPKVEYAILLEIAWSPGLKFVFYVNPVIF